MRKSTEQEEKGISKRFTRMAQKTVKVPGDLTRKVYLKDKQTEILTIFKVIYLVFLDTLYTYIKTCCG